MVKLCTELSSSTLFNLVSTKYSYDKNNSVLYLQFLTYSHMESSVMRSTLHGMFYPIKDY